MRKSAPFGRAKRAAWHTEMLFLELAEAPLVAQIYVLAVWALRLKLKFSISDTFLGTILAQQQQQQQQQDIQFLPQPFAFGSHD